MGIYTIELNCNSFTSFLQPYLYYTVNVTTTGTDPEINQRGG